VPSCQAEELTADGPGLQQFPLLGVIYPTYQVLNLLKNMISY